MKTEIPKEYQLYLRIGTCSWKYDSWKGLYYEKGKNYQPDEKIRVWFSAEG